MMIGQARAEPQAKQARGEEAGEDNEASDEWVHRACLPKTIGGRIPVRVALGTCIRATA
jgi:hypothetical protein